MSDMTTYRQLTEALFGLGFTAQARGDVTIFTESAHDAVIIVPTAEPTGVVPVQYTVAARETVFWKGIASRRDFERKLAAPAAIRPQARRKAGATIPRRFIPAAVGVPGREAMVTVSGVKSSLKKYGKASKKYGEVHGGRPA